MLRSSPAGVLSHSRSSEAKPPSNVMTESSLRVLTRRFLQLRQPVHSSPAGIIATHVRFTVLLAFFLANAAELRACDFCNSIMGINPYYTESDAIHVSMMFQRSSGGGAVEQHDGGIVPVQKLSAARGGSPDVILLDGGSGSDSHTETKWTIEIAYRYHLMRNLMVTGLLPYHSLRINSSTTSSVNGPGDFTAVAQYILKPDVWGTTPVTLMIGGGFQLPTGVNSRRDPEGGFLEPHMQPGSGSLNYVLSMTATAQPERWTLAFDVYGKLNTRNNRNDRLGNSLALAGFVSREILRDEDSGFAVAGNGGIRAEFAARDIVEGVGDPDTGFTSFYGNLGVQLYHSFLRLDSTLLVPVIQDRPPNGLDEKARFVLGLRIEL